MDIPALLTEVNQALTDLVAASNTDEISNTLVEMLDVLRSRTTEAPQVHIVNNVEPTPVTLQSVVNIQMHGLDFSFKYDQQDRLIGGRAVPIKPKG
jgi:hypothetical protein